MSIFAIFLGPVKLTIISLYYTYTSPHIHLWILETLQVIIFWVWVIHKRLNVNWKRIHSIILSFTCHSLRNFSTLIHIPHIHSWIFKTLWVIISWVWVIHKCWMWIGKNSLNNFICHLPFLKKLFPTHTHPAISIYDFLKPYRLLFLEFESFVKGWMWIGKRIHSRILSFTCHSLRNFPPLIHIPPYPFMNFQNPMSYYFSSLSHS